MLNQTIVQGRLTKDPELKYTQSNIAYVTFTVAWSEKYKETETKLFLSCKAWRGRAEMIGKYFKKGSPILLNGRLTTQQWKDDNGNDRSMIQLAVDGVNFCGDKKGDSSGSGQQDNSQYGPPDADGFSYIPEGVDEELPFS